MFGRFFFWVMLMTIAHAHAYGQRDTVRILNNKITREILDAVTRKNPHDKPKSNVKSEDVFLRYEGRIIRRIIVRRNGFEKSIYDSTRSMKNTVTRIANSLHTDTREQVIRDNLFFKVNKPLNPYLLADNERYLRDLDFILDSKIRVIPLRGRRDSVDIIVTTRDVFTLGIRARVRDVDKFSFGVYEANLMGQGQRIGAELLVEREREPLLGKSFIYTKSSLFGSLANLSAGYTELDNARSLGEENETAYFLRLDRPLVSPYSRMAGGLEISRNWSANVYQFPDSLFRRYRYDIQDVWAGYNFGIKRKIKNRTRRFVGLRYNRQHFGTQPMQTK
jgi:outer membrane protein assembly factor BamA